VRDILVQGSDPAGPTGPKQYGNGSEDCDILTTNLMRDLAQIISLRFGSLVLVVRKYGVSADKKLDAYV